MEQLDRISRWRLDLGECWVDDLFLFTGALCTYFTCDNLSQSAYYKDLLLSFILQFIEFDAEEA